MITPEKCLLGKIISDTHITDKQPIISKLNMAWNNYKPITATPWKDNFLSFVFGNPEDVQQVLDNSPWFVNRHYVSLLRLDPDKTLNEMDFDKGQFWVQVHDLPLGLLTCEYATVLAKSLGRLVELDCVSVEGLQTFREFLRFKVEVDVTKPLVPGFFIQRLNGKESWAPLKYEGLCDFCYRCGRLGHCRKSCSNEVIEKYAGKWGSEMCTSKLQRLDGGARLTSASNNETLNISSSFPSQVNLFNLVTMPHHITGPLIPITFENSPSHHIIGPLIPITYEKSPFIQPVSTSAIKRKRDDLTRVLKEGEKDKPCKTPTTVTEKPCKKEPEEILIHPYFKNITVDLAIKLLSDKEPGEVILHPKCNGPSDLTLTIKFYDGVYAHKNIIEDGKTLKIEQAVFANLDEVFARYVDPLVGHLKKMLGHRLFKHGTKAEVEESLRKEKSEHPLKFVCSFSISHELPGRFILTYVQTSSVSTSFVHLQNIGVHPKGYSFQKTKFHDIDALLDHVHRFIYRSRENGGSESNTDKGQHGGGLGGGLVEGYMSVKDGDGLSI